VGKQSARELLNHARLRGNVEINQHVTADNDVHRLHGRHLRIVEEVQPVEPDDRFQLRGDCEFVASTGKVFVQEIRLGIAETVLAIDSGMGGRD